MKDCYVLKGNIRFNVDGGIFHGEKGFIRYKDA